MMNDEEEKGLTACESLIMKVIWDAGEDISAIELREKLKERFEKDYTRTTLATFLLKLTAKGYVSTYHIGRNSYVKALKSEDEYKQQRIKEEAEFWFSGRASNVVSALCKTQKISKEDADKIRSILDELDD